MSVIVVTMHWILEYSPIFFDFDGLLVNTEHLHYNAYKSLLEGHGVSFPWDYPTFAAVAQKSSTGLCKIITAHSPELLASRSWDELYGEKKAIYEKFLEEGGLELMAGVEEVLGAVQAAEIPHAVVTNSTLKQISLIREQLPLLKTIPHWITREEYKNPKPSPDAYLKAIEVVGSSDRMLGFEDALKGIHALEGASITPVLVCSEKHPQMEEVPKGSLRYYPSLTDLL
ncbi:MAG: Phosphorylated carbohydrates phosphatase [Chlamydiae bacterium]|nr:Phosphorylated carbohydrates phosphatase [Chlamydiota bacterium]